MSREDEARAEVARHFDAAEQKSLLRFITCGSVDDGKSTLIGRLLHDCHALFDDQVATLAKSEVGVPDFASLVDGLAAEREQGITIDVAYRFFATERRKFIVADTPGHEQYTRNMVTGASTADLAVILIDARKGLLPQSRRHSKIVHLLGTRELVLAVNKMDLIGHDEARFNAIVEDFRSFADSIGIERFTAIPVSGLSGENIVRRSEAMSWYGGATLLDHLETVPVVDRPLDAPLRMAVQWVNRPHQDFRGYSGRIASGQVVPGQTVAVLPGGRRATIERIVTYDGDLDVAVAGQSVTLVLDQAIDCSRGDLIVAADIPHEGPASALDATLIWMADEPLAPGRSYWLKTGTQLLTARVSGPPTSATLGLNDIGDVRIALDRGIPRISYAKSRTLGGFILIDKFTNATIAAGLVRSFPDTTNAGPARDLGGVIEWVAPAWAGSHAWAAMRVARLRARGRPAVLLDEPSLRQGLAVDLPPTAAGQSELVRRAREIARLMCDAGIHVIVAIGATPDEAHPGHRIDHEPEEEWQAVEWII
ncbi:GTP-binding protein [Polymorphobacter multimanifer]|uniref:Bifunctional enzyme NodQ n=1 Tax=Polymorphobacter multimanifer TaxID=1070431 RepID=A0A841L8T7_9SPHN|nr:GTP-binding protein [Polymorphobacter multimanifer]MBB6229459.1 bifunctional enzyme CysN/CysC [Polymorphobacter multimanifer]